MSLMSEKAKQQTSLSIKGDNDKVNRKHSIYLFIDYHL
jgi:hypothetical protein